MECLETPAVMPVSTCESGEVEKRCIGCASILGKFSSRPRRQIYLPFQAGLNHRADDLGGIQNFQ